MERSVRPHGLTTLAILNFIFAGFKGLVFLISIAAVGCINAAGKGQANVSQEMIVYMIILACVELLFAGLLIVSGIGYLKMNRVSGRLFGSIWALAEIAKAVLVVISGTQFGAEFNLWTMISFIYPLLTLFFVNIVFRDLWRKRFKVLEEAEKAPTAAGAPEHIPHVFLIIFQSIRQTLRGVQGILFLLITLFFFLFTAHVTLIPLELANKQFSEISGNADQNQLYLDQGVKQFVHGFFTWLLDEPVPEGAGSDRPLSRGQKDMNGWAWYLVNEKPAIFSLIFAVMTALLPVLASFLVFNQISEDAKRKGYRYLLLRTTRASIYFGKFISSLVILIPIIILSLSSIAVYIHFKLHFYPFEEILSWSLQAMITLTVLSIPSVAFCLFFSALFNSSFGSLALSSLTLGFSPIIIRLIKDSLNFMGFLQYLHPLKAAYFLYHPEWWVALFAALGGLLYAAVFTGGGYLYFKRKSL